MKYLKTFNEGYNYKFKKIDNPNFNQYKENIFNMLKELGKTNDTILDLFDDKKESIEDMWNSKLSEEKAIDLLLSLSNRFKYVSPNFNFGEQNN